MRLTRGISRFVTVWFRDSSSLTRLGHKVLKRYLEYTAANPEQFDEMTFQDLIRTGNEQGLLLGEWPDWRGYRDLRGATSHTYNEDVALEVVEGIPRFIEEVTYLRDRLRERLALSRTAPGVDLRPDHWAIVCSILRQHVPDREVLAFGSRATWTAKDYSDLDLAIMGDEPLTRDATSALAEGFGESDLPFKVDVVDWAKIDNIFRNIVRRDGVAVQVPRETSKATGPACRSLSTSGESIEEASQLGICAEIVMGQSPPGNTTNTSGDGVPLLNGPTEFGSHHPEPTQFTTDARKMAYPGDLLFCVRGSTTGRMNWADQEYAIGRGIASLRHKRGQQFQPFVQAVVEFSLPDLLNQATGSTFPNVSARQLATI